jgi:hypothetical protein
MIEDMPKWQLDVFYTHEKRDFDDPLHVLLWQLMPLPGKYHEYWRIAIETEYHFIRVIAKKRQAGWGTFTLNDIRSTHGRIIRYEVIRPGFPFPYPNNSVNADRG